MCSRKPRDVDKRNFRAWVGGGKLWEKVENNPEKDSGGSKVGKGRARGPSAFHPRHEKERVYSRKKTAMRAKKGALFKATREQRKKKQLTKFRGKKCKKHEMEAQRRPDLRQEDSV